MSEPSNQEIPTPEPPENDDNQWLSDKQARYIIWIIVGVWSGLTIAGSLHKYTGVEYPPEIHSAFFGAVGLIMMARAKSGGGG